MTETATENPIKVRCNDLRRDVLITSKRVIDLKKLDFPPEALDGVTPDNRGEMIANVMLAYRHLEDARMRLGKVIQALEGGVSKYDAPEPA